MKVKRRKKSSRFKGSQTAKRGAKERTRNSGNRGGFGMAGTGKRADQKKSLVINLTGGNNYFGKSKTLRRGSVAPKLKVINLRDIENQIKTLSGKGLAKENKGIYEINLKGYKILGEGELGIKANITADSASASAIENVKKNGSKIIIPEKKKEIVKVEAEKEGKTETKKVKKG